MHSFYKNHITRINGVSENCENKSYQIVYCQLFHHPDCPTDVYLNLINVSFFLVNQLSFSYALCFFYISDVLVVYMTSYLIKGIESSQKLALKNSVGQLKVSDMFSLSCGHQSFFMFIMLKILNCRQITREFFRTQKNHLSHVMCFFFMVVLHFCRNRETNNDVIFCIDPMAFSEKC